jgi:hypothetical protein
MFFSYAIVIISNQATGAKIKKWKEKIALVAAAVGLPAWRQNGWPLTASLASCGSVPFVSGDGARQLSQTYDRHVAGVGENICRRGNTDR